MVSLDQEGARRAALLDPDGFVSDANGLVCIDEIQRAPELLLAIKAEVDRDRRPGRFLLTGSADLASDAGFPASTLPRYLDIIEYRYLLRRVPSWSTNLTTRVVGRPKTYLTDCGLAAHLLGLSPSSMSSTVDPSSAGRLLEAFVVNELHQQQGWGNEHCSIHHYRDRTGPEVDVVVEHVDGRVVAIEVKAGMSLGNKPTRWLSLLRDRLGGRFVAGVVLYTGREALPLGDRLAAMPIEALWRAQVHHVVHALACALWSSTSVTTTRRRGRPESTLRPCMC